MSGFVLEEFLPYQLAVLSNRVSAGFSGCYAKKFGISVWEWRVIAHLMQDEKISIREIFDRVEMDKSKISRAAARLEKAGYVHKKTSGRDRRLVELSLTDKGRAMADEIGPMGLRFETSVLACLPEGDRAQFLASLSTLLEKYA